MKISKIAALKKIAVNNKDNSYLLKICLLGLYSEWEGFINAKIDELLSVCNEKHNKTIFSIPRERFRQRNRNIDNNEFRKIHKEIFGDSIEKEPMTPSFFTQRNKYAHGDFDAYQLDNEQFQEYTTKIQEILFSFEDEIDSFITNEKHLKS